MQKIDIMEGNKKTKLIRIIKDEPEKLTCTKKTRDVNHGLRQLELGDSDTCLITKERARQYSPMQSLHRHHP